MSDIRQLLQQRSTVRHWDLTKPIEQHKIDYIKDCVKLAPYGNNEYGYRIFFITNRDIINKLFHTATYCYEGDIPNNTSKVGYPIPDNCIDPWMKRYNGQMQAPLVIVFAAIPNQDNEFNNGEHHSYFCSSIAMLAAQQQGLNTGLCGCINSKIAANILGLDPDQHRIRLALGVGYMDNYDQDSYRYIYQNGNAVGYSLSNNLPGQGYGSFHNTVDLNSIVIDVE